MSVRIQPFFIPVFECNTPEFDNKGYMHVQRFSSFRFTTLFFKDIVELLLLRGIINEKKAEAMFKVKADRFEWELEVLTDIDFEEAGL